MDLSLDYSAASTGVDETVTSNDIQDALNGLFGGRPKNEDISPFVLAMITGTIYYRKGVNCA